jgi:hypothetical protein
MVLTHLSGNQGAKLDVKSGTSGIRKRLKNSPFRAIINSAPEQNNLLNLQ